MPVEPAWKFYPKYAGETLFKAWQWTRLFFKLQWTYRIEVKLDPRRMKYSDLAMTPVMNAISKIERASLENAAGSRTRIAPERRCLNRSLFWLAMKSRISESTVIA